MRAVIYGLSPRRAGSPDFACRESEIDAYVAGPAPVPVGRPAGRPPATYPVESALLQADRVALSLRGALERITVPLARAAAVFVATKAWCDFGFARLDDCARERLGCSGRWVRDLAALGDRLRSLPSLAAAITGEDGSRPLGRVAALLIARVASPETLDGWIALARSTSIRALRDAVRAARSGAHVAPSDDAIAATAASAALESDDDVADRLQVTMTLPSPVLAAFDEAVDLFRAVEGGEATIASFVEALVAESATRAGAVQTEAAPVGSSDDPASVSAGSVPMTRDADLRFLRTGPEVAAIERGLAASTSNWRHLPEHAEASWALSLAGMTLSRFRALADEAGRGDACDLDRQFRDLVEIENEIEARLGGLLADLGDRRAWPRLRFAGVGHYGEERLGLSRTAAEDRARLARDLRRYPRLREAYDAGRLGRETAALVARLLRDTPADPARETAWVARAAESTVKRMRDEARTLGRYRVLARAGDEADASDAAGAWKAVVAAGPAPAPLDDADWHASLRRAPGIARRRVRVFGALTLTSPDVFHALPRECDAFLRLRLPLDIGHQFLAAVDAERRRLSAAADALPWDAGAEDDRASTDTNAETDIDASVAASPSWLAARMFSIRCRRLPAWVGLLALLEDFVDTWDDERAEPRRPGDDIYIRDGWRCAAPGCSSRRNLEVHHIRYRSRGGDDGPANLICLCRFHHQRGEHGGLAACRGRAPIGVTWRLGSRDVASTWYRNERRIAGC